MENRKNQKFRERSVRLSSPEALEARIAPGGAIATARVIGGLIGGGAGVAGGGGIAAVVGTGGTSAIIGYSAGWYQAIEPNNYYWQLLYGINPFDGNPYNYAHPPQ